MRAPKASIFLSITSLLFSWLVVAPAAGEVRGNISAEASPFPWSCVGLGEAGCSSLAASLSLSSAPEGSSFLGILKATFSAPPPPPTPPSSPSPASVRTARGSSPRPQRSSPRRSRAPRRSRRPARAPPRPRACVGEAIGQSNVLAVKRCEGSAGEE